MLLLISLAIALFTAFFLDKQLKKHPAVFYITAAVLTVASVAVKQADITISNEFVRDYLLAVFTRGAMGAAFWAVVMWAGALPNGTFAIKKLMPIRGELSITAAVLTLSHVITYGIQYISDIIRGRTGSGEALRDFIITSIVCLVMVLIMLPLTVMSFKSVRKKMNAKTWKKIQRFAYLFYALIFIHVMVLFVPKAQNGRDGYFLNVLVYSTVFIGYAAMRLRKMFIAKKKPAVRTAPNIICACAMIVPLCIIGFIARNTNKNETIKASKEAPAVFTFDAPAATTASSSEVMTTSHAVSETTAVTTSDDATEASSETVTETVEETTSSPEETGTSSAETTTEAAAVKTEPPVTEPVTQAPTEAQHVYRFKNGTFEGSGEGYAGKVNVSINIENDFITGFSAYADDDDPEYFSDAMQKVIPQIQQTLSADVDACSGATYSSKGIMEAARNALESAKN